MKVIKKFYGLNHSIVDKYEVFVFRIEIIKDFRSKLI